MTFETYTKQYEELVLPLKKRATQATFSSHLRALRGAFGSVELAGLEYGPVQRYFTGLAAAQKPKSVANRWATMHLVLRQAQREGLITKIPEPVLPKNGRSEQEWLTIAQMRAILTAAGDPALYWLLCETGMRIGEALGLQPADLNPEKQLLKIERSIFNGVPGAPKTSSAYRTIAVSRRLRDLLAERNLDCPPGSSIFHTSTGRPLWPSTAVGDLHADCKKVGITPVGFHAFRRGHVTHCSQILGMPEAILAYRVGHKPPGITLGVYNQPMVGVDTEWAEKMAEALQ